MPSLPRSLRNGEIAAVVFDLDGVLLDSEPLHYRAASRVFAISGKTLSIDAYRQFIGCGALETWAAWKGTYGLAPTVAELIAADEAIRLDQIRQGVDPILEAAATARQLKADGMPLAIASSSKPDTIDAELAAIGMIDVFAVRVSVEHVKRAKPAPDVYLRAAEVLDVPPNRCLAIEDSAVGVRAAKAAGMLCIAVPTDWTRSGDFGDADAVLESLRYFPLLIS